MKKTLFVLVMLSAALVNAQESKQNELEKFFRNHDGAIVIFNHAAGEYVRYNEKRCEERFLPASTFKIANSLIGLETGVIPDENYTIKWDGIKRSVPEWNRDNTLATAIQYSVVPYYQKVARKVGREKYLNYLKKVGYGNEKIGMQVDTFWLDNSLKISADEQVEFLKKFYDYKLPFSKRSVDLVKKIMPSESYNNSVLKFKTGIGKKEDGTYIGWLIGYVEKEKTVSFFAFNVDARTFEEVGKLRDEIPRTIMKQLKILE